MASPAEISSLLIRLVGDGKNYQQMLVQAGIDMKKFTVDAEGRVHNLQGQYVDAFDAMNNSAAKSILRLQRFRKEIQRVGKSVQAMGQKMRSVGRTLTFGVTLPMIAAGAAALKVASNFETSFAGIRKTTDATETEFAELRQGIRDMAKEIPGTVNEFARIGEVAGQLGIAKENLLSFIRVMVDLGNSTDLTAEEASVAMARLANITGLPQTEFDKLGSALVELGNNFATTEPEILAMGTRIAGAGAIAGLAEAEILAIGAAMSSVGIEAQAGGTAVQKVLIGMTRAVAENNEDLAVFAQTAGMSAAKFAEVWRDDAGAAFQAFVEGIGAQGEQAFATLDTLNLKDQRLVRAFLSLGNAGDLLERTMNSANAAFAANSALAEEAAKKYATFGSRISVLKDEFMDVIITLGDKLKKVVLEMIPLFESWIETFEDLVGWFDDLSPAATNVVLGIVAMVAAIGPLLGMLGLLTIAFGAILANPIVAATMVIVLLTAALGVGLFKAWTKVSEAIQGFVEWLITSNDEMERTLDLDKKVAAMVAKRAKMDEKAKFARKINAAFRKSDAEFAKIKVGVELDVEKLRGEDAQEKLDDIFGSLQGDIDVFGMKGAALDIKNLEDAILKAKIKLTAEEMEQFDLMKKQLLTKEAQAKTAKELERSTNEAQSKAAKLLQDTLTPLEKLEEELKEIQKLSFDKFLSEAEAKKASDQKIAEFAKTGAGAGERRKSIGSFTKAGSLESFRAKAQARKDSEAAKARAKQLKALEDILLELKKDPNAPDTLEAVNLQ